jgi:hypothetical protein
MVVPRFGKQTVLCALAVVAGFWAGLPSAAAGEVPHSFDGQFSIGTIHLTVVYLVPKDRAPLTDWRERVDYYMKRIDAFQRRESGGTSRLLIQVHPEPLMVDKTAEVIRGTHPDQTFDHSIGAARSALKWPNHSQGFPILLVLSEINWRELDDFHRTRMVEGKLTFEGNIGEHGRHFPGAESGGARAIYHEGEGLGMGLVSADGWRVPYSGSDCVVYHEGIGHPIGLPHPEPIDDSVMGTGQYRFWINQTWVTVSQKKALGWVEDEKEAARKPPSREPTRDLFTAFTALPRPIVPAPNEPVSLGFTWPVDTRMRAIKIRVQTELRGPWHTVPSHTDVKPPDALPIGAFDRPTPVSYRVDAVLEDGQSVELWGYFQVKERR